MYETYQKIYGFLTWSHDFQAGLSPLSHNYDFKPVLKEKYPFDQNKYLHIEIIRNAKIASGAIRYFSR
jgi:hypothetical protein